jgi:hypothetical protein
VAGALFTAVTAAGLAPVSASAATTHSWIATGWNIHLLDDADPGVARHFFNTPISYGTGTDRAKSPVLGGFAATPVLWYTSYHQFAADVKSGAITYPYGWVIYDPEHWPRTPVAEQQDPQTYLRLFGQLAHAHGYHVIEAPARDLGLTTGSICPMRAGETLNDWYLRCDITGMAAPYSDAVLVQDQANMPNLREYDSLFSNARGQALAANPNVSVFVAVSTNRGTAAQMAAAAESVAADGYYVTIRSNAIQKATQFFKTMRAAGY